MIAIDTNVLVRFLTQDEPAQAAAASAFMRALTPAAPGFISREVMVELVWVLERAYRFTRVEVAAALEGLLAAVEITVEAADDVGSLVFRYRDDGFGFADLMIAAAGQRAGAATLVTFDRTAAGRRFATPLSASRALFRVGLLIRATVHRVVLAVLLRVFRGTCARCRCW